MSTSNSFTIDSIVEPLNLSDVVEQMIELPELTSRAKSNQNNSAGAFQQKSDLIFLIGTSVEDISSSLYLSAFHNVANSGSPYFDAKQDEEMRGEIKRLTGVGILQSVHEVSVGGLFFALFESAAVKELGFDITLPIEFRRDAYLFGESKSRTVITIKDSDHDAFLEVLDDSKVPHTLLGHVTKNELRIDDESYGFMDELKVLWNK
jgi:phosphoribosylformylglycinamidine (FGAM) synthase-like enzyme